MRPRISHGHARRRTAGNARSTAAAVAAILILIALPLGLLFQGADDTSPASGPAGSGPGGGAATAGPAGATAGSREEGGGEDGSMLYWNATDRWEFDGGLYAGTRGSDEHGGSVQLHGFLDLTADAMVSAGQRNMVVDDRGRIWTASATDGGTLYCIQPWDEQSLSYGPFINGMDGITALTIGPGWGGAGRAVWFAYSGAGSGSPAQLGAFSLDGLLLQTLFTPNPGEGEITALEYDGGKFIYGAYAGTEVFRYNIETDVVLPINFGNPLYGAAALGAVISDLRAAKDGMIWGATAASADGAFFYLDPSGGIVAFNDLGTPPGGGSVHCLSRESASFIWAGTTDGGGNAGLSVVDTAKREVREGPKVLCAENGVRGVAVDRLYRVWAAVRGDGELTTSRLLYFDPPHYGCTELEGSETWGMSRALAAGRDGTIWGATENGGVFRVGRPPCSIAKIDNTVSGKTALEHLTTVDSGIVWGAASSSGSGGDSVLVEVNVTRGTLEEYAGGTPPVPGETITALASAMDGRLWGGTESGRLFVLDTDTHEMVHIADGASVTQDGSVTALLYVPGSGLWGGTRDPARVFHYSDSKDTVKFVGDGGALAGESSVPALTLDGDGRLWGGTEPGGGLFTVNIADEKVNWDGDPVPDSAGVNCLMTDGSGEVWGASGSSLPGVNLIFKMDGGGGNLDWWSAIPASWGNIRSMTAAWDNGIWASTDTNGRIFRLDGWTDGEPAPITRLAMAEGHTGDGKVLSLASDGIGGLVGGGARGGADVGAFTVGVLGQYTAPAFNFWSDVEWGSFSWGELNDPGTGMGLVFRTAPKDVDIWLARYELGVNASGELDLDNPENTTIQYTLLFYTLCQSHTPRFLWGNLSYDGLPDWKANAMPDLWTLAPGQRCNITVELQNGGGGPGGELLVNVTVPPGMSLVEGPVETRGEPVSFFLIDPDADNASGNGSGGGPGLNHTAYHFLYKNFTDIGPGGHVQTYEVELGEGVGDGVTLGVDVGLQWTSRLGKVDGGGFSTAVSLMASRPVMELEFNKDRDHVDALGGMNARLTVHNNGTGIAYDGSVLLDLPSGLELWSYRSPGSRGFTMVEDPEGPRLQFDPIYGWESQEVNLHLIVAEALADGGVLPFSASMEYRGEAGVRFRAESGTQEVTVRAPRVKFADAGLQLNCTPGAEAKLMVLVVNDGSGYAGNVWVDAEVPEGFEMGEIIYPYTEPGFELGGLGAAPSGGGRGGGSAAGGGADGGTPAGTRFNETRLGPNETLFVMDLKMTADARDGDTFTFPVWLTYADGAGNRYSRVNGTPLIMTARLALLNITAEPAEREVFLGENFTVNYTITNHGTGTAQDVFVNLEMHPAVEYSGSTRDAEYYLSAWSFGTLGPGEALSVGVNLTQAWYSPEDMDVRFDMRYHQLGVWEGEGEGHNDSVRVRMEAVEGFTGIESIDPGDGSANVSARTEVVVRFFADMDRDSVEIALVVDPYVDHDIFWDDERTMRIRFPPGLEDGTTYEIRIGADASTLGGLFLGGDFTSSFTTAGRGPDTIGGGDGGDGGLVPDGLGSGDGTSILGSTFFLLLILLMVIVIVASVAAAVHKARRDGRAAKEAEGAEERSRGGARRRPPDRGMVHAEVEYQPHRGMSKQSDIDRIQGQSGHPGAVDGAGGAMGAPSAENVQKIEPADISGEVTQALSTEAELETPGVPGASSSMLGDGAVPVEGELVQDVPPDIAAIQDGGEAPGELDDIFEFDPMGQPRVLALPPARSIDDGSAGDGGGENAEEVPDEERSSIDKIFLLSGDNILMSHYTRKSASELDPDIISSMLMAVQAFVRDSLQTQDGALDELKFGEVSILIRRGEHITIAAMVRGKDTAIFGPQVESAVTDIERAHPAIVTGWDGDMESTRPMDEQMKKLVLGEYAEAVGEEVEDPDETDQ